MSRTDKFLKRARLFIKENKLKSNNGFLKYVILNYVNAVNMISDDFIFKGGNLIWLYIKTPRATIDVDFCTKHINSHKEIKAILNKASNKIDGINYVLENFEELVRKEQKGAKATIVYATEDGASNKFEIDIVYATPVLNRRITSIDNKNKIIAASIESIIMDKIDACHRFKSGNTRIKDYDDLYRIITSGVSFNKDTVIDYIKENKYEPVLDKEWITNEMVKAWHKHLKLYSDLPTELEQLFGAVNINMEN